jgi:signal transduction histidine kinase
LAEILVYGTIGPVLTFLLLEYLGRWLEERETSELQAMILTQARETARIDRELNDNTLQAMFATSVLLDSIKSSLPYLPPEVATQLQAADKSLDGAIRQLREHLLHPPG